jgi:hypothetical protein
MVNVRVREHNRIDRLGLAFKRQIITRFDIFRPLIETAVNVDTITLIFEKSARTGNKTGRAEKLHANSVAHVCGGKIVRCYTRPRTGSFSKVLPGCPYTCVNTVVPTQRNVTLSIKAKQVCIFSGTRLS